MIEKNERNEKIEQHMYSRVRAGVFRTSAGYDTIAASRGLSAEFIKNQIHPHCVYPQGANGEAVVSIAHFPCGRMLLGQAVFVPKDFTGLRSTFFLHNYILPAKIVDAVLCDIENILRNVKFLTCEPQGGFESLNELPMGGENSLDNEQINKIAAFFIKSPFYIRHKRAITTYSIEDMKTCPDSFLKRVINLPPSAFFNEMLFFETRLTKPQDMQELYKAEAAWFEANLEKLTKADLVKIPAEYIARGKQRDNPEIFTILGILKTIAGKSAPYDLRYIIGSYALSDKAKARLLRHLHILGDL